MKRILIMLVFMMSFVIVNAQLPSSQLSIKVGEKCPDFILDRVKHFKSESVSRDSFSGKWLVLDFWSLGCSSCIADFPKYAKMQEKFGDKIQMLLVGVYHKPEFLEPTKLMFDRSRKKFAFNLAVAFDDMTLFNKFNGGGVPYIIVLDPSGIVRAITHTLSEKDVDNFLAGQKPVLWDASKNADRLEKLYTASTPLLINSNGSAFSNIVYRSMITQVPDSLKPVMGRIERTSKGRFEAIMQTMAGLYKIAYRGGEFDYKPGEQYYPLILETRDSTKFEDYYSIERKTTRYSYSLILPENQLDVKFPLTFPQNKHAQKIMQDDLERYFGYKVKIEMKSHPYYKLFASPEALEKIKSKGGILRMTNFDGSEIYGISRGIDYQNCSIDNLIAFIKGPLDFASSVINETGYDGNIDIKIKSYGDDFNSVIKELKKIGIEVILSSKEMETIVIYDVD